MNCNVCHEDCDKLEIVSPPINAKEWSDKLLRVKDIFITFTGTPKYQKKCNKQPRERIINKDELTFYRFWQICESCRERLIEAQRLLGLPFKPSDEVVNLILETGIDNFVVNQKQLDYERENKAWRNRKKYRGKKKQYE